MANDLTITQISAVLNAVHQQVTGQASIAPVNTYQFVNVAQNLLKMGYNETMEGISQVLTNTIFSVRPYYRKFQISEASPQTYGLHVRKWQVADSDWENDARYGLENDDSVDMYTINKPEVLQTNFYGAVTRQRSLTIFKDQLDTAMTGPEQFGRFITMIMQNSQDQIEQAHESLARMTVVNYMAGMYILNNLNQIVHLVTEFNEYMGLDAEGKTPYTKESLQASADWEKFIRWAFGRMNTISEKLTDRTSMFHNNIPQQGGTAALNIQRHTPIARQRAYFFGPDLNNIGSGVLSTTFHDQYLRMLKNEKVNYWQNPTSPDKISVKAAYTNASGVAAVTENNVNVGSVFGLLFDEEALGTCIVNQWSMSTPFNAKGGYSNIFWHFTDKWWNDFTENAVLFVMD